VIVRSPRQVFPPGRFLGEELKQRGWSQADFAVIIGRPPRVVNEIIKARRAITPETALALGSALNTGAEFWLNMESFYQLSKTRIELAPITRRARIYERFPIREMQKRGWIPTTSNLDKLESSLLQFFGVATIDADLSFAHAAKRTSYAPLSPVQAAWLSRARHLCTHQTVGQYESKSLAALYAQLRRYLREPQDVKHVAKILSSAGIRFVIVEALPGSKIDGACIWLTKADPAIALSLRYDRHDMFWHALLHELDHIEHEEGLDSPMLDRDLFLYDQSSKPETELRANNNAADHLIPRDDFDTFVTQAKKSYSVTTINRFADQLKIHPGIVVGRLQHSECIPWSSYSFLKSKVRPFLTGHALTDGFGLIVK
jgi:HTH-type transcriptional regulator / antitoxin HigA